MERGAMANVVELPSLQGKTEYLHKLDMLVMDVLTPLIGFEKGTYALRLAGYRHIGDIVASSPEAIAQVPGMLPYKVRRIASFLRRHQLRFGMETSEWRVNAKRKAAHEPDRPHPENRAVRLRLVY